MESGRPYSRLLHRLERLNTLSAVDRQRIAELPLKLVNYPAGRDVVLQGYSPSRCTLVLDGFLCGHKPVSGSRRQITSFFVAGDIADLATLHLPAVNYSNHDCWARSGRIRATCGAQGSSRRVSHTGAGVLA
jgi:hypothetical protein